MGKWIKHHKFWSSALILFFAGLALSRLGVVDSFAFGFLVGQYIFFGWLIKIIFFHKKREEVK